MHPFPPVVRWALFPALAALPGGLGGALAMSYPDVELILGWFAAFGLLAAGSALGACLSGRLWLTWALALPLSVFWATLALTLGLFVLDIPAQPFPLLRRTLAGEGELWCYPALACLQTLAHASALGMSWKRGLGVYLAAALLALPLTYAARNHPWFAFASPAVAAQFVAWRAAEWISGQLNCNIARLRS
jgi:hypothetical protein